MPTSQNSQNIIKEVLLTGTAEEKKLVFSFSLAETNKAILTKFKLFAKTNYPRYFQSEDALFHDDMVLNFIDSYRGIESNIEIAFRGAAKTSIKKLFDTFVILNDKDNHRKYIKVLSKDLKNSKQVVTDVYNLMVEVRDIYGNIFEDNSDIKREETMAGFTTATGVKYTAGTIGQTQRGHLQDAYRPDWIWFDDVEDRETVSSLVQTEAIIQKADEAIQGLAFTGTYAVTANYISDAGVVQWFINKKIRTHIVPIVRPDGTPTWARYTPEKLEQLQKDAEDWAGEYLCDPTRTGDKFFDIDHVERDLQNAVEPSKIVGGVRFFEEYKPNHRYAIGTDLSDGVGKDSCALSLFDMTTGMYVASYDTNTVSPDLFMHEAMNVGNMFGGCLIAPEINNTAGGIAISTLKDNNYPRIYRKRIEDKVGNTLTTTYGYHTNSKTKPTMLYDFKRDYNDGLIIIKDKRLLTEMKQFTKHDLQDTRTSAVTRHFDLLVSACICWQMRNEAEGNGSVKDFYKNLKGSGAKVARS